MIRRTVRRRKAGFTLAELLVALVVICLLSTCVFLITRSAAGTFTRGEDVISANDLKSIALEYVRQELRTASAIMLTDDLEADGGELIKSGAMTGKTNSLKVTVAVYRSGEFMLEGSEVVDLINMRQENGEIKGAAGRYCFYAA